MLLTSVIIVLREVLEASLLISILAAISGSLGLSRRWVAWALGLGAAGAVTYSLGINTVSDWFDGMGQEVFSAAMQFLIYLLLAAFTLAVFGRSKNRRPPVALMPLLMTVIVALAVTREGFEVLVYLYGFADVLPQVVSALTGAAIGASIGISIGALLYYMVVCLDQGRSLAAGLGLLALVGAGLLLQAVSLLIQADWLPSQLPLWDTSGWLSETSVTGQLLYVLIGYEATPTAIQVGFYLGGLSVLLVPALLTGRARQSFG